MRNALKVLALGAVIAASATMAKADTISYIVKVGGTTIGSGTGNASGDLTTNPIIVSGSGYTVNITGSLPPLQAPANFSTNTTTLTQAAGAAGATITIEVTDQGLTSGSENALSTFTTNSLDAASFVSDTITNYVDSSNTAFGTGTQLATDSFSGSGSFSGGPFAGFVAGGTYSETTIYTIVMNTSASSQSLAASSQVVASPTPEPGSLALLGTGLLGAAGVARRRLFSK